jgi:carbonic anhydrase/acetyltransferase-like protein (isoleucine patch superfamily)
VKGVVEEGEDHHRDDDGGKLGQDRSLAAGRSEEAAEKAGLGLRTLGQLRSATGCGIRTCMNLPADDPFPGVFVAPSASLFGEVAIGVGSSVWLHAVVRAECQEVRIGRVTNLQDFVMIHVGYEHPTLIGDFCSITHHATIHGATVGDGCLVGIGAVLMDGVVLGAGSIVAGGAVLREGSVFEPGSIVAGVPGKVNRRRDSSRENRLNAWLYHRNAQAYGRGEHRAWQGPQFERWKSQLLAELATDDDLKRLDLL